jgi:putative ABC transport system permease protein
MARTGEVWRRWIFLLQRRRLERELAEEMQQHAEWKARKNIDAGAEPEEARLLAQRQLGNTTRQQEDSRQIWGFPRLESVVQDIRYGLRGLRYAPGFTIVALLTLSLGIGAATAICSIVNAVLLRPLPYRDSSRLVHIWTVSAMFPDFQMGQSIPNLKDIQAGTHSLEATAVYEPQSMSLTGGAEPQQLSAAAINSSFLGLFGIHPALGRNFLPEDEQRLHGDVALLSHSLWQRRFASDPNVVGTQVVLGEKPFTVAGVLPAGFSYPDKTEVWVPLVISSDAQRGRGNWRYFALGKLRAGISLNNAQLEMNAKADAIGRQYPEEAAGIRFPLVTVQEAEVGNQKSALLALLGAVGFLLLIACANVSNLVLARGLQRQREIALRAALGASRGRILRQLFTESLLLALGGGLAGIMLAAVGVAAFRVLAPAGFPRLDELRIEPVIAVFALMIATLAGILFGLAPALATARSSLNLPIHERAAAPCRTWRYFSLRGFLALIEVAMALILLTGSALMVQSIVRLLRVETGMRIDHLTTAQLTLAKLSYGSPDAQRIFARRLLDALRAQRQFSGVALTNGPMLEGSMSLMSFDPALMGIHEQKTTVEERAISPEFFATMGIRFLGGRAFDDRDEKDTTGVVIISQSLARRYFPGQDPVGKLIKLGKDIGDQRRIVGIVSDTRDIHLRSDSWPQIYSPLLQSGSAGINILVRSPLAPAAAATQLRSAVWSVDKNQPLDKVRAMTDVISSSVANPRFRTWLLGAVALAGLALTLIGIYGVVFCGRL